MLIVIPLLSQNDPDASLRIAVQLIQRLAVLNATNPEEYQVKSTIIVIKHNSDS